MIWVNHNRFFWLSIRFFRNIEINKNTARKSLKIGSCLCNDTYLVQNLNTFWNKFSYRFVAETSKLPFLLPNKHIARKIERDYVKPHRLASPFHPFLQFPMHYCLPHHFAKFHQQIVPSAKKFRVIQR